MKLGASGFIVYDKNQEGGIIKQSFPALSVNPVDVFWSWGFFTCSNGYWVSFRELYNGFCGFGSLYVRVGGQDYG